MNRWPEPNPYFWETAPFARLLLPLVAGIGVYYVFTPLVPGYLACGLATVLFVAVVFAHTLYGSYKKNIFSLLLYGCIAVAGYGIAWGNDVRNSKQWFGNNLTAARACMAVVDAQPLQKDSVWKLTVNVIQVTDSYKTLNTSGRAFVYIDKEMPMLYHRGDTLLLPADWQTIKNAGNPHEFNYARHCARNNICHQQYCGSKQARLYAQVNTGSIPLLDRWHAYATAALHKYLCEKKVRGLLQAMLLGDEADLDPELRDTFSNTGIVHVIAISGGNVMIFFMVIGYMLQWIRHNKYQWIKYIAALPLVWLYVVMAGASPSAIRAALMFSILALGFVLNKNNNPLNQLMATAFILLCARPQWLLAVGFQLSFLAVLSLIIFYGPLSKLYTPGGKYKWLRWLRRSTWGTLCASLAAEVLVAPLVVYYFHNFPVWFLVANVLAWALMFAVLVGGMAIVAFAWAPILAAWAAYIISQLVHLLNIALVAMRQFSPLSFQYLLLSGPQLLLLYIVIASVSVAILLRRKRPVIVALACFALLIASLTLSTWQSRQQSQLIIFNVGRYTHIERCEGGRYNVVYTNAHPHKIAYAVKDAHINLQAWQSAQVTSQSTAFVHNGKRFLIIDAPVRAGSFPVDYLVLTNTIGQDIATLKDIFKPTHIILAGNCSQQERQRLRAAASAAMVPLHITGTDGAFIAGQTETRF